MPSANPPYSIRMKRREHEMATGNTKANDEAQIRVLIND
jgi:hypothetical protein